MSTPSASRLRPTLRSLLTGSLAGAMIIWSQIGVARSEGPFASFSGSWRGSGHVVGMDGHREQIRCRGGYSLSDNGEAVTQTLVCASDSYQFDINSYVVAEGHNVRGHWQETTRQVQGSLSGSIADGWFEGNMSGPNFTAEVSLRSAGGKQVVNIRPSGGDIAAVDVILSRSES